MDEPISKRQRQSLRTGEKASFRLLNFINDILDLAKMEAHEMELEFLSYPIVEIVHSSLEEIQSLAID